MLTACMGVQAVHWKKDNFFLDKPYFLMYNDKADFGRSEVSSYMAA